VQAVKHGDRGGHFGGTLTRRGGGFGPPRPIARYGAFTDARNFAETLPVLPFQNTFRNVRRYHTVIRVLARHGFNGFLEETGLDRLVERGFRLFGRKQRPNAPEISTAERVRHVMEDLGPTFVKLGQILSTRRDIIPDEWATEFSRLQDAVPAVSFERIRGRLEEAFGEKFDTIFASVEERPLAAGSMAQVHRATLVDGTPVVLKILRPDLDEIVESDLEALQFIAERVEGRFDNLGISPVAVVEEFSRQLRRELDLTHEGRATDRLRNAFLENERVIIPAVYWDATCRTVLALEQVVGTPLTRLDADEIPQEQRTLAVDAGADAVLRQCLELGYFHADPHPGNLFYVPDGRLAFIDFGMTGQLDTRTRRALARLVYGAATGDVEEVVRAAIVLGEVDADNVNMRALLRDVQEMVDMFRDVPLDRFNLAEVLDLFFVTLRRHNVRCPADVVLLIKALGSIEFAARRLDSNFDMLKHVRPYVERILREEASPRAIARRVRETTVSIAGLIEHLPDNIGDLMERLRRGRLGINLEHRGLNHITSTIEHASRNIAYALVVAALLVSSSIVMLAGRQEEGFFWTALGGSGFILAGLIGLGFIGANRRYYRRAFPKRPHRKDAGRPRPF